MEGSSFVALVAHLNGAGRGTPVSLDEVTIVATVLAHVETVPTYLLTGSVDVLVLVRADAFIVDGFGSVSFGYVAEEATDRVIGSVEHRRNAAFNG